MNAGNVIKMTRFTLTLIILENIRFIDKTPSTTDSPIAYRVKEIRNTSAGLNTFQDKAGNN